MNKLHTIIVAVLLSATLFAQSPEKISYQAIIRDSSDHLVSNQDMGMQIQILQGSVSGSSVYTETHSPTSNQNGLVSIEIGSGTSSDIFANIDWSNGPFFIKTETDPTSPGGTNYTITATSQLLSVPFALHSKTAEKIKAYEIGDFVHGGIVFWVDESGQHGLACAKEDQSTGIQWYNGNYTDTEAHGDNIYSGAMNTMLIIANQGSNSNDYAAGICANLIVTEGGKSYGDWYLPSKEELNQMYLNKSIIDASATLHGGSNFTTDGYWSSTEDSSTAAWRQYFDNSGAQFNYNKSYTGFRVRAVRKF